MRYITPYHGLRLLQKNGEVGKYGTVPYEFDNGELIIGDPKVNTAGNVIVPNLSATDGTALQQVYTTGTDLAKVGQGTLGTDAAYASQVQGLFYEAPSLTVADSTQALVIGLWYKVISGSITHNSVVYTAPQRFKATASSNFTGTGTARRDLDSNLWSQDELNERAEAHKLAFTLNGDEMVWNDPTFSPTLKAMGWTR